MGSFQADSRNVLSTSSWLAALKMFFLPLTSFTVCHANHDYLSTEFLILLIWP